MALDYGFLRFLEPRTVLRERHPCQAVDPRTATIIDLKLWANSLSHSYLRMRARNLDQSLCVTLHLVEFHLHT